MPRPSLLRWLLLPCLLLMACKKREEIADTPPRPRGVGPAAPVQPTAAVELDQPSAPELLPLRVDETPSESNEVTLPVGEAVPEAAEKQPRNLQQELESMIGSPVDCLTPRLAEGAPRELHLSLSASVMPSGAVGRGDVSGSAELTRPELDCVRSRLEGLHFATPIENAPLTVNGSITLKFGS
ncbi:MAG TPA: hypothetical protein VJV78_31440 [Polyangiales bacterium]|nr:hypothetical protein [Polyangiales bacterium]